MRVNECNHSFLARCVHDLSHVVSNKTQQKKIENINFQDILFNYYYSIDVHLQTIRRFTKIIKKILIHMDYDCGT